MPDFKEEISRNRTIPEKCNNPDLARARRLSALVARRAGRGKPVGLPAWIRPEWSEPLVVQGEPVGTLLVVPASARGRSPVPRPSAVPSAGPRRHRGLGRRRPVGLRRWWRAMRGGRP